MSLKIKIISLFVITIFIPFIVVAVFIYVDIKASVEKSALEKIDTLATIQKARTLDLIHNYTVQLEQFTTRLQLRQELVLYNKTKSPKSQEKMTQIITEAKKGSDNIKDISILTPEGIVAASTNPMELSKNHSEDMFFQKGKDKNNTTEFFKEARNVYLNLVGPLTLQNKKIGVVIIEAKTESLFKLFKDHTGLGETGTWGLAKKAANGDALIIVPGRFDTNPDSPLTSTLSRKNTRAPITQALMGNEQVFPELIDYRGKHVIASTRYIPEFEWGIGVIQERSEAFAATYSLATQLIFFSSLLVIFIGFLSSVIAQILTSPIVALSRITAQVTSGDLSVTAKVTSRDEIGTLASNFNEMTSKLKDSYKGLEEKIEVRTAELNQKVTELERLNNVMVDRELKMIELKKIIKKSEKGEK